MKNLFLVTCCCLSIVLTACQKDDDAFLKVDKKRLEQTFNANGGLVSVPINSNNAFEVSSSHSWCQTTIVGQSVRIHVDSLKNSKDRYAEVIVNSGGCLSVTIKITQNVISLNEAPDVILLSTSKSTFSLNITSGARVRFDLPDWITAKDTAWIVGTKSYQFSAEQTTGGETRKGTLNINSADTQIGYTTSLPVEQSSYTNEAMLTLYQLWQTAPFAVSPTRRALLAKLEGYSELLSPDTFRAYLTTSDAVSTQTEKDNPILSCYRYAFDHVLERVKYETVEQGTAKIWLIYNMGFVVKTPSVCFGVDVNNRWAIKLEPYLDFMCVSHNHNDHSSPDLMQLMSSNGKPVVSNYSPTSGQYLTAGSSTIKIGTTTIKTDLADHDAATKNFSTQFRIDCGEDSGNFSFVHYGDSSSETSQHVNVAEGRTPSLLILRFGQKVENNLIGTGSGQVKPVCAFLSHVIELRHNVSVSPMRATILGALGNVANISTETYLPFWGEQFIWKDGKIEVLR